MSKTPMRVGDARVELREKDDEDGTKGKEVKMALLASEQFDCAPSLCRRRRRLSLRRLRRFSVRKRLINAVRERCSQTATTWILRPIGLTTPFERGGGQGWL